MGAGRKLPLRLLVRKPVRVGGRSLGTGSTVSWRTLGMSDRKANQLVRQGFFADPFRRGAAPVEQDGEAELRALSMAQLRELLPEGAKARDKSKAIQLILDARAEDLEVDPE